MSAQNNALEPLVNNRDANSVPTLPHTQSLRHRDLWWTKTSLVDFNKGLTMATYWMQGDDYYISVTPFKIHSSWRKYVKETEFKIMCDG